jgi:Na+/melibiose symporter-like transporter
MAVGQAAAMLASGLFMWGWARIHPDAPRWVGYAVTIVLGGGFVLAAAVPLALMPAARERRHLDNSPRHPPGRPQRPPASLAAPAVPLVRGRFLRLLVIGCWISITNGLLQSPQTIFPNRVLGLSVLAMLALKVGLRLGQWPISPRLGKLTDRWGNRPVMALSLLVVAQGPAFYFLATPRQPWWIVGAWACWIAWAGLNIALPNLMLTLSPARSNTPYIATYFAVTGLCHGLSTILGGSLFDRYGGAACLCPAIPLDYYHAAFLLGWITWSLGAVLVLAVVREPPAGEGEGTGLGR